MIVKVEAIKEGGLHLEEPISLEQVRAALEDARGSGFASDRGFRLVADLHRVGAGVLVEGRFTAEVVVPCRRCNVDVRLMLPTSFTLNLVPRALAAEEEGLEEGEDDETADRAGSFRLQDSEQEFFDGKQIDLNPILREQLLLALPMNALCSEECKGLCGSCGQNLNEGPCACDRQPLDPRLAVLKQIKLN
ncbi:MAG TPA: DUF177 domain-containing protein [Myxococcaceae bacterium]|nr:DUF177 domain-containing protein [Myxococcaceae bacterium]